MSKRLVILIGKISLLTISLLLAYQFCYFIAEHFFFDKFFYRKSATFGYVTDPNSDFVKYGERSKDVIWLRNAMKGVFTPEVPVDKDTFTIALIGDSYVWGQGIKNEDRFAKSLEKELGKTKKVKVYSYAMIGDNFLQNYEKIKFLESLNSSHRIDLYVLVLVPNDIFVTSTDRYLPVLSRPILSACQKYGEFTKDTVIIPTTQYIDYHKITMNTLSNASNLCIANKIIESFPKNLLVFDPKNIAQDDDIHDKFVEIFNKYNRRIVSPIQNLGALANSTQHYSAMMVSKQEGHPSALANTIFEMALYKEITSNPEWGFNR